MVTCRFPNDLGSHLNFRTDARLITSMAIYTVTYEVEAESEDEALRKVREHYAEPQEITVEED